MILLRHISLTIHKGDFMRSICPFLDTIVTQFYNKAHCEISYNEISEKQYIEYCQSYNFRRCPYFISFCEKAFAAEPEALEMLDNLKGQTD